MPQTFYKRDIDEIESCASKWWPDDLIEQNANISVVPTLLSTQDKFLHILALSNKDPEQVFDVIQAAKFPINLFTKHLCVLADFGGEPLQRLSGSFNDIFEPDPEGVRKLRYTWNGCNHNYSFKALPLPISNSKLKIDGKRLYKKQFEITPFYRDVNMLLIHGAASQACGHAALSKCEIGSIMGNENALESYVKQRYITVSRITGGATANTMGQLAQLYVVRRLRIHLNDSYSVVSNGKIDLVGYDKGSMPFDIVVTSKNKTFGIEISFQVTTNSTIERKSGQAADRAKLMHDNGHLIGYIIDGAGNFQRRSAVSEICKHSDCTVAYSDPEIKLLANWILENED